MSWQRKQKKKARLEAMSVCSNMTNEGKRKRNTTTSYKTNEPNRANMHERTREGWKRGVERGKENKKVPFGPKDVRVMLHKPRTASMFLTQVSSTPLKCFVPSLRREPSALFMNDIWMDCCLCDDIVVSGVDNSDFCCRSVTQSRTKCPNLLSLCVNFSRFFPANACLFAIIRSTAILSGGSVGRMSGFVENPRRM